MTALASCAGTSTTGTDVAVVGDSVMAWNDGRLARRLAAETGMDVDDRSVSGAQVAPNAFLGLTGFAIGNQVPRGRVDWVVMNGGANDLILRCGCGQCDADVERLIDEDGRAGLLPRLWRDVHDATGARVVVVGYYDGSRQRTRFTGCRNDLAQLDARASRFAAATAWAVFVDGGDVVTADMLDPDQIHPSVAGSDAMARLVAQAVR